MKIDTCCDISSVANVTPKTSPKYLLRSPVNILSAIQFISAPHHTKPNQRLTRDFFRRSLLALKLELCQLRPIALWLDVRLEPPEICSRSSRNGCCACVPSAERKRADSSAHAEVSALRHREETPLRQAAADLSDLRTSRNWMTSGSAQLGYIPASSAEGPYNPGTGTFFSRK